MTCQALHITARTKHVIWGGVLGGVLLMLGACASPSAPERYYLLSPQSSTGQSSAAQSSAAANGAVGNAVIGIGPITIPSHLDRSQMISRGAGNRLLIHPDQRWAEPLDENITRVLAENIDARLHPGRMEKFPWNSRDGVKWQITADLISFEQGADGQVTLTARWKIVDFQSGQVIDARRYQGSAKPVGTTTADTVSAMNALLAAFADSLANPFLQGKIR